MAILIRLGQKGGSPASKMGMGARDLGGPGRVPEIRGKKEKKRKRNKDKKRKIKL